MHIFFLIFLPISNCSDGVWIFATKSATIAPAAADSNVDFGQFGKYPNTISFKTIVARFARKMTLRKSVIVIGGGIMSLGTSLQLAERGYKVTLLEKQSDVAKVASYINGAMICPSMTATWASSHVRGLLRGVWWWSLWLGVVCLGGRCLQDRGVRRGL